MRVGLVANGLLLKGDKELELVLLCSDKPTITLLKQVAEKLTAQLEVNVSTFSWFISSSKLFLFLRHSDSLLAFLTFCSLLIGDISGDIYSKPVSRGCSHCCDEHQVDPDSDYPHDIASCQSGAREYNWRRNRRYICFSGLRLDISYHRPDLCVLSMQTLYCSTDL